MGSISIAASLPKGVKFRIQLGDLHWGAIALAALHVFHAFFVICHQRLKEGRAGVIRQPHITFYKLRAPDFPQPPRTNAQLGIVPLKYNQPVTLERIASAAQ